MNEIGFIGLGRMGGNMVQRITQNGSITPIVWNRSRSKVDAAVAQGAVAADSIAHVVAKLKDPRKVVWLMLPSGEVTENVFQEVLGLLNKDDIIIDGGNSNFQDSIRRHKECAAKNIGMLDVGVSGGIVAAQTGYPMMVGGGVDVWEYVKPLFDAFGYPGGYNRVGSGGTGHYVKMIHNAIEYGMMQAISEGFDLLKNGRFSDIDLLEVSKIWNNGCIVDSFLMKMTQQALEKDPELGYLKPYIEDNGEGKWSAIEAMEYNVPFVVNSYALHARYISRDPNSYAFRMVAAQRNEFGGHAVKK